MQKTLDLQIKPSEYNLISEATDYKYCKKGIAKQGYV